ncbi:hypothetical protein [Reinekea thalattae]|uniref:MSHA biogenesis protein MshI n=1 Tax=Reinekea thalattae TaxID=2593301 RepID=A0A5C8ZAK0_9GAMM|nr:hypothetical protein [Reinekea thalattae]TXR54299.1 hypothetical protein FME95_07120 [Reinekea thalattae]
MNISFKRRPKKQYWLKIEANNLVLFENGAYTGGLPYIKVLASIQAADALHSAAQYASWVKQHVSSTLNLLIAEDLYQLILSDMPDVPSTELASAMELKAAELLSYDIDDALIDIIQLPPEAYRSRTRMAFIIAMQKSPMEQWLSALVQVGIRVPVIDVAITQLRNFGLRVQNYSTSGLFHIEPNRSHLILNYNDEMVLSRTFDSGINDLDAIDDLPKPVSSNELFIEEEAQSAIQLESLALDIRRSFDYYESQLGLGAIAELNILCRKDHQHLVESLATRLGVRCNFVDPSDYLHLSSSSAMKAADLDADLIGSAFREALS